LAVKSAPGPRVVNCGAMRTMRLGLPETISHAKQFCLS
jgi:hypothetical protein